mmetsp:Transcript_2169/g.6462  ORF Transcript_2169/g.6462 Transcript_2169/m.6462 type:complete len:244 (-) Transcript_2169:778-1509(-)
MTVCQVLIYECQVKAEICSFSIGDHGVPCLHLCKTHLTDFFSQSSNISHRDWILQSKVGSSLCIERECNVVPCCRRLWLSPVGADATVTFASSSHEHFVNDVDTRRKAAHSSKLSFRWGVLKRYLHARNTLIQTRVILGFATEGRLQHVCLGFLQPKIKVTDGVETEIGPFVLYTFRSCVALLLQIRLPWNESDLRRSTSHLQGSRRVTWCSVEQIIYSDPAVDALVVAAQNRRPVVGIEPES